VGDDALMRYVVFLLHAGYSPYSKIIDINLPGSYAFEAASMTLFGDNSAGLRLYDGALCLLAAIGAVALSAPNWRSRICGAFAALLFILIHLRDGVVQAGQRDLAMAVIVVLAYALFLRRPLANSIWGLLGFEFLIGLTLTIKPTLLPLAALPLLAPRIQRTTSLLKWRDFTLGLCSLLLPLLAMFAWLQHWHSVTAFLHMMDTLDRQHSLLAHKTLLFLLTHSVAPVGALVAFCLVLATLSKLPMQPETKLLLYGAACALLSFLSQGKGFSYQRYPFLLLALILIFRSLARGLSGQRAERLLAAGTLCVIGFWLSPTFARTIASYDRTAPFQEALSQDLLSLQTGPSGQTGNSGVQCLDTVGGCLSTLNDLKIVQTTGFLYDCYAYSGTDQQKEHYRAAFLNALTTARAHYIVLTSEFCLEAQGNINRIDTWQALGQFLHSNYRITREWKPTHPLRWWNQKEQPPSYQIFTLKDPDPSSPR
jgi:hypothetical protein